mgnify:CR=1 FL=1
MFATVTPPLLPLSSLSLDITASVVKKNKKTFATKKNWRFGAFDLTSQALPRGYDLIHTRDALQHLSCRSIVAALRTLATSSSRYLLVGSYNATTNVDIEDGEPAWRRGAVGQGRGWGPPHTVVQDVGSLLCMGSSSSSASTCGLLGTHLPQVNTSTSTCAARPTTWTSRWLCLRRTTPSLRQSSRWAGGRVGQGDASLRPAGRPAGLPACRPAHLPARPPAGLPACLPACLPAHSVTCTDEYCTPHL